MVERTCRFISNRSMNDSPSFSTAEDVFEKYIQPVVTSNFENFTAHLYVYEDDPGSFGETFLESIVEPDIVIADLTHLSSTAYFQLGARYQSGKPLIFIADEEYTLALHPTNFPFVKYRFENDFSEDAFAAQDLVNAIHAVLDEERSRVVSVPDRRLSPRQTRARLATRIVEAAEAIRFLRINSATETAIELEEIAQELELVPDDGLPPAIQATIDKFLRVLWRFADQLATIRGARMLISGLISVVLAGAGVSAVTAFGLCLAFWEGRDAFLKAIESLKKRRK